MNVFALNRIGRRLFLILALGLVPAAAAAQGGEVTLEPGGLTVPRLDHQRAYYGTFESAPDAVDRTERAARALRERTIERTPATLTQPPEVEVVPTYAELEAAKARATAETALEISRRAEEAARQATQESVQAREGSAKAIENANQAIARANESIAKVNEAIDRVNQINQEIRQEIARLKFDMEQETKKIRERADEQDEEIARLKSEIERMRVKLPETYMVKRGDYLIRISARPEIYGDAGQWRKIYQANRNKIRDPNLIYPGQSLVIPR